MERPSSATLEQILQSLKSKVFATRKAAAMELSEVSFNPSAYPNVEPGKLAEFERAIKQAAAEAIDPKLMKRGLSLTALAPGFAGIALCLLLYVLQISPGAILWGLATLWLGFWYFRTLAAALRSQTASVRQAVAFGRELGILNR